MNTTRRLREFLLHEGGPEQPHKKRTALAVAFLCGVIDELTDRVATIATSRDRSTVVERLCRDLEALRANMRDFRKEMIELKGNLKNPRARWGGDPLSTPRMRDAQIVYGDEFDRLFVSVGEQEKRLARIEAATPRGAIG